MERFQFIEFVPTPAEKHIGIMKIRILGPIVMVVAYKIVPKKDGSGFFPAVASYKMPNRQPGEEYDECFMVDSRSDHDAITKFIMSCFAHYYKPTPSIFQPVSQNSIFASQGQAQPNPIFAQNAQQTEYQPSFLQDNNQPPF